MNANLYALCRQGTDPAITRALEEAASPWGQVSKLARKNLDWGQVADITGKLTEAMNAATARLKDQTHS